MLCSLLSSFSELVAASRGKSDVIFLKLSEKKRQYLYVSAKLQKVESECLTSCFQCKVSTTATLKSGRMFRRGETHDHRRTRRNREEERTGSDSQGGAGV